MDAFRAELGQNKQLRYAIPTAAEQAELQRQNSLYRATRTVDEEHGWRARQQSRNQRRRDDEEEEEEELGDDDMSESEDPGDVPPDLGGDEEEEAEENDEEDDEDGEDTTTGRKNKKQKKKKPVKVRPAPYRQEVLNNDTIRNGRAAIVKSNLQKQGVNPARVISKKTGRVAGEPIASSPAPYQRNAPASAATRNGFDWISNLYNPDDNVLNDEIGSQGNEDDNNDSADSGARRVTNDSAPTNADNEIGTNQDYQHGNGEVDNTAADQQQEEEDQEQDELESENNLSMSFDEDSDDDMDKPHRAKCFFCLFSDKVLPMQMEEPFRVALTVFRHKMMYAPPEHMADLFCDIYQDLVVPVLEILINNGDPHTFIPKMTPFLVMEHFRFFTHNAHMDHNLCYSDLKRKLYHLSQYIDQNLTPRQDANGRLYYPPLDIKAGNLYKDFVKVFYGIQKFNPQQSLMADQTVSAAVAAGAGQNSIVGILPNFLGPQEFTFMLNGLEKQKNEQKGSGRRQPSLKEREQMFIEHKKRSGKLSKRRERK